MTFFFFPFRPPTRLLITYASDSGNELKLHSTGTDGLSGFVDAIKDLPVRVFQSVVLLAKRLFTF